MGADPGKIFNVPEIDSDSLLSKFGAAGDNPIGH